mgnify:CR=1 FL=1
MKKIGICTVYTGYNYGSALQAFAIKELVKRKGYVPVVFKLKGSIVRGRDFRLKKFISIAFRSIFHFKEARKIKKSYISLYNKNLTQESKNRFDDFYKNQIDPSFISYGRIKKISESNDYLCFFCGSDQIWNSTSLYVDPFYYLRFAPKAKRVAYAPSFGKSYIPQYNVKIIKKYVSGIDKLSVREETGKQIIFDLLGKKCDVLFDPTLQLTGEEWGKLFNLKNIVDSKYIVAYFLDQPSDLSIKMIKDYSIKHNCKVIILPYKEEFLDGVSCYSAGPVEFLSIINFADCIFTDSFHGTAFSVNFNKNFYTFSRNYGSAYNQGDRIGSFLSKVGLESRLNAEKIQKSIDYVKVNEVLKTERTKSALYLSRAVEELE